MFPALMPWFLTYDLRDILKPVTSLFELVKAVAVLGEKKIYIVFHTVMDFEKRLSFSKVI
jgi:hypothetical protein